MLRVGLTGGIGSGKSEVSRLLAARGALVIDSDVLARAVVAAGTEAFDEVVEAFGASLVAADGELDRAALGRAVFGDETARRRLEAIVHPGVRDRAADIESRAASADPDVVVVHDIPLLVETGQADHFDLVVVVDAPDELRLDRLVQSRGMARQEAAARIAAQVSRQERLDVADEVVDNSDGLAALEAQVEVLWQRLAAAARLAS